MYYAYVLQSLKDYGFYIGYTSNIENRIKEHNSGKTQSLKRRTPLQVIYKEKFSTRIDAIRYIIAGKEKNNNDRHVYPQKKKRNNVPHKK